MSNSSSPVDALSALVVDDEELACRGLRRKLLAAGLSSVEATTDPAQAVELLRAAPPDVLFLDVDMPELSGFDVLAQFPETGRSFAVVFCTASSGHATRAFEAAALDYLVKPVDPVRLGATVARLRRARAGQGGPAASGELARARSAGLVGWLTRLVVRSRGGAQVVEVADVEAFVSEAHRAVAYTADGEHVLDPSLAALEAHLDPGAFARTHRAWLVALSRVVSVEEEAIHLASGRRAPLSRRNRAAFLRALKAHTAAASAPGR